MLRATLITRTEPLGSGNTFRTKRSDVQAHRGFDLSEATSLVEIWNSASYATDLEGKLVIPGTVTLIG